MFFILEHDLSNGSVKIIGNDAIRESAVAKVVSNLESTEIKLEEGKSLNDVPNLKDGFYHVIDECGDITVYAVVITIVSSYVPFWTYNENSVKAVTKFTCVDYKLYTLVKISPAKTAVIDELRNNAMFLGKSLVIEPDTVCTDM
jgi:hypothetical protein